MILNTNRRTASLLRQKQLELANTLCVTNVKPRTSAPGAWVCGDIAGHRFEALVFSFHAMKPDYELADSRISKLWVQRTSDGTTVANFDRGWDLRPANEIAREIVDTLSAALVARVLKLRNRNGGL